MLSQMLSMWTWYLVTASLMTQTLLHITSTSSSEKLRVQNTRVVSPFMNARLHAARRHYVYRLALLKDPIVDTSDAIFAENFIPLAELDRLHVIRNPLDVEVLRQGCALMQREADFASFMSVAMKHSPLPKNTIRNLKVELRPGQPLMNPIYDPTYNKLQLWDVAFTSQSFLYNQIRRCLGVIISLAKGLITTDHIEDMFSNPRVGNWPSETSKTPAHGLYLLKVEFPDHVLDLRFDGGDLTPATRLYVDTSTQVKTAVALGQTKLINEPPSPADLFAQELSDLPRDSGPLYEATESEPDDSPGLCDDISEAYDEDEDSSSCRESTGEGHLQRVSIKQNSDTSCNDGVVTGTVRLVEDLNNTDAITSTESHDYTKCRNSFLLSNHKKDSGECFPGRMLTPDGHKLSRSFIKENSYNSQDSNRNLNVHISACRKSTSSKSPRPMRGSERRRLLSQAYELAMSRREIDDRLAAVLRRLIEAGERVKQVDCSAEGMARIAEEIKLVQQDERQRKILLASLETSKLMNGQRKTDTSE
ncbi:uncharacterized protein LOC108676622 isoform X2 [Hyalella azteca]|uniref:Uncharacterized protein LOC108676622 isoform X2 n=1 Tax=Hyalella azteca TaxID=294128 RepID=A0A8B7P568_HYAAZ|nr:uncharacterized protein LOC108676622 isoform X2 [Hyalella azteca]